MTDSPLQSTERLCPTCGGPMRPRKNESRATFANRRYCSAPCVVLARRATKAHRPNFPNPEVTVEDGQWRQRGLCLLYDPEVFFPEGSAGGRAHGEAVAVKICRGCPVSAQCLDWALSTDQEHGVWGATTEDERRALKRQAAS